MKPHIKVEITAGTIANMTTEQFEALKNNVCAEGRWETAVSLKTYGGGDYLGVEPMSGHITDTGTLVVESPMMYIGIERDGYTHS